MEKQDYFIFIEERRFYTEQLECELEMSYLTNGVLLKPVIEIEYQFNYYSSPYTISWQCSVLVSLFL